MVVEVVTVFEVSGWDSLQPCGPVGTKSFGLSHKDAQKNDWRLRIKGNRSTHGLSGKWYCVSLCTSEEGTKYISIFDRTKEHEIHRVLLLFLQVGLSITI